jgi:UDP-GlcNAc:undecaprenyl-phosphate/decaprenyl-phosphate GlcNAc-1-phosphate transferase
MEKILTPFIASFLITLFSTPLTIKLAKRFGFLDDPKTHKFSIQNRVIPKAGGIPIFLAIFLSILIFIPINKAIIGIILGILILLFSGLWDDLIHDLSPYPRLIFQLLAAAMIVAFGVGITFTTNPFGGILRLDQVIIPIQLLGTHTIVLFADIFAFFWILFVMNMVNWSWGVDGQMPGIISVAAITIGVLSLQQFIFGDPNQLFLSQLSFITAATALGFLVFNWYPSKILPGDSASNILGFMVAVLCILSSAKLATALLVLLVPAVDFFYTLIRRILSGKSPFFGDQKHLHHLLLKRGWSPQKISLVYIASSILLSLVATNLPSEGKLFTVLGAGTIVLGIILWLHLFPR